LDAGRGRDLHPNDFPLISRADIQSRPSDFVSDVLPPAARDFYAKTSGTSSGNPLTVRLDLAAWYELNHETFATVARGIPGVWALMQSGQPGVELVTNERNRLPGAIILLSAGCALLTRRMIGAGDADDLAVLQALRKPFPILYGKASYLQQLAELDQRAAGAAARVCPSAILVSGENLFPDAREELESWFRCPVFDAYTSAEGGLIGLQCAHSQGLHLQSPSRQIQVLTAAGEVSEEGSGELILTNHVNWAMPFIRYRTGDWGTLARACSCGRPGPALVEFSGREAVEFKTPSVTVSPERLSAILRAFPIKDYHLTQRAPAAFELKWVPSSTTVSVSGLEPALRIELGHALGDVSLDMHAVDTLRKPGAKSERYRSLLGEPGTTGSPSPVGRTWRIKSAPSAPAFVRTVAFSPTRRVVAWGSTDGTLGVWDQESGRHRWCTAAKGRPVLGVACSPDGERLAAADAAGRVTVLESDSGAVDRILSQDGRVWSVAFAPGSPVLACGASDRTLRLWDLAAGDQLAAIKFSAAVLDVSFSPDGESLALATADGWVHLLDSATSARLFSVRLCEQPVAALRYSASAKLLACAAHDGRARLLHLPSATEQAGFSHPGRVFSVAFSPDSRTLATACSDGAVRLWSLLSEGAPLVIATGRPAGHWPIAYSPDGSSLACGGRRLVLCEAALEVEEGSKDGGHQRPADDGGDEGGPDRGQARRDQHRRDLGVQVEEAVRVEELAHHQGREQRGSEAAGALADGGRDAEHEGSGRAHQEDGKRQARDQQQG